MQALVPKPSSATDQVQLTSQRANARITISETRMRVPQTQLSMCPHVVHLGPNP
jgi:hypothetical protein